MSGFYGFEPLCKKCPFPSYGPACQRICACENKTCNHITGCFESISDIGKKKAFNTFNSDNK